MCTVCDYLSLLSGVELWPAESAKHASIDARYFRMCVLARALIAFRLRIDIVGDKFSTNSCVNR